MMGSAIRFTRHERYFALLAPRGGEKKADAAIVALARDDKPIIVMTAFESITVLLFASVFVVVEQGTLYRDRCLYCT